MTEEKRYVSVLWGHTGVGPVASGEALALKQTPAFIKQLGTLGSAISITTLIWHRSAIQTGESRAFCTYRGP